MECAVRGICKRDLLFVVTIVGGSRGLFMAVRSYTELVDPGGRVLLCAALVEHAGWHGGGSVGYG